MYLLIAITGPFRLVYIPSVLFVRGNASATANNIASHEALFRLGIVSGLVEAVIFSLVGLALYRLLKAVDQNLAGLMVIFVLISAAVGFVNEANSLAVLIIVHGAEFLSAFDGAQRDALAMLFVSLRGQVILATEIFWGLWLFPLAILVYRSRFLPRFLGVWLTINGVAYVTLSFTGLLLPQHIETVSKVTFPAQCGELALVLWLVIKGANPQRFSAAGLSVSGSMIGLSHD
jgi:hypothetical protein